MSKVSRRKLLGGAAATSAALPVLARADPASGAARRHIAARGRGRAPTRLRHDGAGHLGAVGRRRSRAQRLRPADDPARLRRGRCSAAACASGRSSRRTARSRSRPGSSTPPGPTTGACPAPRCAPARASGCGSASSTGRSTRTRCTSTASTATSIDGVPGVGAGNIEPGDSTVYEFDATPFGLHLYHCHSTPLADHIAKGLYGAFIIDPKDGRADADELVMVMNGFDTNFDRSNEVYAVNTVAFAYMHEPIRVKRGELVRIYLVNALEFDLDQLVPHPRQLLRLLPDRHAAGADRVHRHGDPGPGRARHPRAALPLRRQVHVPRPRLRIRGIGLDGLLRGGGLMEAATAAVRRPLWLTGLIPVVVLAVAIGALRRARRSRARAHRRAPGGAGDRAHRAARGRDRAARAQRRRGPGAGQAGDRQRRLRVVQPEQGGDRPARRVRGDDRVPLDRGRELRGGRCSPPPAPRSATRSSRPWRRRTPISASTA